MDKLEWMFSVVGLVPVILTYGTWGLEFWLAFIADSAALLFGIISGAKMVGVIRRYKLGFSSFVFLSLNWFFIRSRNRNNFFIITLLTIGFFVAISMAFLLPYSGAMILYSLEWYSLFTSASGSVVLSALFYNRAMKKAAQLEEMNRE